MRAKDTTYAVGSRQYLRRAYRRLLDSGSERLFYAAYELRCCIEARIGEYAEANKQISKKKAQGWRIDPKYRELERVLSANANTVYFGVNPGDGLGNRELYFTPITVNMKRQYDYLGNYMHQQSSSPQIRAVESELEGIASELRVACSGTLLGPPLFWEQSGKFDISVQFPSNAMYEDWIGILNSNAKLSISVQYLSEPPLEYIKKMDASITPIYVETM